MYKTVLPIVIAGTIAVAAALAQTGRSSTGDQRAQFSQTVSTSTDSTRPQFFEGTWQGVWHAYGVVYHTENGSESSLSLTLKVNATPNGKLSGITSTSAFQHQPTQNTPLSLGASPPRVPPPQPPLPTPPPSGKMLNPRIEGGVLVFAVKAPDGKQVDFRLSPRASNAGTLKVTSPTHSRAYPEFQMKRMS